MVIFFVLVLEGCCPFRGRRRRRRRRSTVVAVVAAAFMVVAAAVVVVVIFGLICCDRKHDPAILALPKRFLALGKTAGWLILQLC